MNNSSPLYFSMFKTDWPVRSTVPVLFGLLAQRGDDRHCRLVFRLFLSSPQHIFCFFLLFPLSMTLSIFSFTLSPCLLTYSPCKYMPVSQKMAFCRLSEYAVDLKGSYYSASVSHWYAILMQIGSTGVVRERESGIGRQEGKKRENLPSKHNESPL